MKSAPLIDTPLMSRAYDLSHVGRGGLKDHIEANAAERAALAAALGLESMESLSFTFSLMPRSRGRFHLVGQVEGQAIQSCVVSLEPVPTHIVESVDMELWPADKIAASGAASPGAEIEVSLEGPEPYAGTSVDLGQIAYELFASALDPYPRKPDARFNWAESSDAGQQGKESPFAALRALKNS